MLNSIISAISSGIDYDMDKFRYMVDNKWDKAIKLATPEEVAISHKGICHEIALYLAHEMYIKGVEYRVLIFNTKNLNNGGICSHAYTTWKDGNLWCVRNTEEEIFTDTTIEGIIDRLNAIFAGTDIESPICWWKAIKPTNFTYTYGEWLDLYTDL